MHHGYKYDLYEVKYKSSNEILLKHSAGNQNDEISATSSTSIDGHDEMKFVRGVEIYCKF